jgi:hypothetical protein
MRLHDHSSENPRQHWTNASNGKIRYIFLGRPTEIQKLNPIEKLGLQKIAVTFQDIW